MRDRNKTGNLILLLMLVCFGLVIPVISSGFFQIPTVDIPTVTGTDRGVVVRVKNDDSNPQINVRSGPGTEYDRVGTLVSNQEVVGKGRTEGGSWILIEYQGGPDGYAWVYSSYVDYVGDLPIVVVPNTPTPRITNTIDPTLAAQFIITVEPMLSHPESPWGAPPGEEVAAMTDCLKVRDRKSVV